MLNRLVDAWNQKEQARDGLVPEEFAEEGNRQRLRTASWVRGLVALVVAGLAVVFFVGPGLSTPVVAALLGGLGVVTAVLMVIGVRALGELAAVERAASGLLDATDPDRPGGIDRVGGAERVGDRAEPTGGDAGGSAALVRSGDEGAELGEGVDLEHEHGVQPDDPE